jgi:hypothetical protein
MFEAKDTCLNIWETGSRPRVILEKSLYILDRSSTCSKIAQIWCQDISYNINILLMKIDLPLNLVITK